MGAVERQRKNLKELVKEMDALKLRVEQTMFEAGKKAQKRSKIGVIALKDLLLKLMEKFQAWRHGYTTPVGRLNTENKGMKKKGELMRRSLNSRENKMKLELKRELEETKVKQHPAVNTEQSQQRATRLPKLEIMKFKGTYEGWLPFWNKFQAEIDKTNLASVTKFAYLKELVDPKVQTEIDGLPFTTEGYERAKNILVSEYGKISEIVNAYAKNIMNLPVITGTQPANIH